MELRVELIPLFQRQIQVDTIVLDGLVLNLHRDKEGRGNWEGLTRPTPAVSSGADPGAASTAPERERADSVASTAPLAISGVKLRNGQVQWHDAVTDQRYVFDDLALQVDAITRGEPTAFTLETRVEGGQPSVSASTVLSGVVELDAAMGHLGLRGIELRVDGTTGTPALDVRLELTADGNIDLRDNKIQISGIKLTQQLQGVSPELVLKVGLTGDLAGAFDEQRYRLRNLGMVASVTDERMAPGSVDLDLTANADLDLEQQALVVSDLRLAVLGMSTAGAVTAEHLFDDPRFAGNLEVEPFDLGQLLKRQGWVDAQIDELKALRTTSLQTKFEATADAVSLNALKARLGDTRLKGNLSVPSFRGPVVRFDLTANVVNLDHYRPPAAEPAAKPATPAAPPNASKPPPEDAGAVASADPLAPLRSLDMQGKLRVGMFQADKFKLQNLVLPVHADKGVIRLSPIAARLYEGRYRGNIRLDAADRQLRIALDDNLKGVQVGPLLQDLSGQPRVTGTGDITAKLTLRGNTTEALKQSLNGTSRLWFQDGAINGINIGHLLREAYARAKGKALPPDERQPMRTDFAELTATYNFVDGVASSDNLFIKSPLLRITGEGVIDLVQERLDYLLRTVVVSTFKGQGGEDLKALKGLSVPVKVSGTFDRLNYGVDLETLIKEQAAAISEEKKEKLRERVEQELEKRLDAPLPAEAKDLLKKLF